MTLTIYHNPRCSKSRETLALIEAAGITPDVRLYMKDLLTFSEISILILQLGFTSAQQLMRKSEASYRDLNLKRVVDESALISAMVNHPKLIERPIVVKNGQAVLGRPPKNVQKLINSSN